MQGGEDPESQGIVKRMVATVFDHIRESPDSLEFRIKVSVVELYMEKVRDLLNPGKLEPKIREDRERGVYIQDVLEQYVADEDEIFELLRLSA